MAQEEAAIAITYSGEAAEAMSNNSHLHYLVPSEGSNLWFDNIVMPRTAKHKDAAYAFLNFMNDPKMQRKMLNTLVMRHLIKSFPNVTKSNSYRSTILSKR